MYDTPFSFFGMPFSFDLDVKTLEERYRKLQETIHPDNYTTKDFAGGKTTAEWMSACINEAYEYLKDPVKRAEILLNMTEKKRKNESEKKEEFSPSMLFVEQMLKWREFLSELNKKEDFNKFQTEINGYFEKYTKQFDGAWGEKNIKLMQETYTWLSSLQKLMKDMGDHPLNKKHD
ncbi:MAG: Fe-S protein assembly co-chaperone HscB [Alphaproteobacteria bacterium]